jgi:cytochrome P450
VTAADADYDHHRPLAEWAPDQTHAELRARCPVAFSEHHGGYWVVTSYEQVSRCGHRDDAFTTDHDLDGTGRGREFAGIAIPAQSVYRSLPTEVDGPAHLAYRRLLQPAFAPATSATWAARAREWAEGCIDAHIETGRIDLVLDLANPVPAMVTLALVGLPAQEWKRYAEPLHTLVFTEPTSEARAGLLATIGELRERLAALVAERRARPADDLASVVTASEVDGRPVSDVDAVNLLFTVISGGLDTTTALVANALAWLDDNPDVRSRMIAEPALRTSAREEFLRVFSPAPATARTAAHAVDVEGRTIAKGSRLLLSWTAANRDPSVFADPDTVDVERPNNRHVAFGAGPHRCIGAPLARSTFDAIIDVVLDRIPDYVVDRSLATRYARVGAVNGWVSIPATFTPRNRTS